MKLFYFLYFIVIQEAPDEGPRSVEEILEIYETLKNDDLMTNELPNKTEGNIFKYT